MNTSEYSPRELEIFSGVLTLLRSGAALHTLKVADIAAAAGLGKGTVYEYFPSKEELLAQAICYGLQQELQRCLQQVLPLQGFDARFTALALALEENFTASLPIMLQAATTGVPGTLLDKIRTKTAQLPHNSQLMQALIEAALADGLLTPGDEPYAQTVLHTVLLGYLLQRAPCNCAAAPNHALHTALRMAHGALSSPAPAV